MSTWPLAWRLARRELSARFRGLRLLLVCLVLGVGALAAIGSLSAAIADELGARGRELLGGDVELSVSQRTADPAERAAMRAMGTVSETIRMQSMAIAAADRTAPVQLKAVDTAYLLYGRLTLADGRSVRAPGPDTAWIAPALADRLRIGRGATLRLGSASFRVGGVLAEEPDRLSEGFTLGPVVMVSRAGLDRTGLVQPGSLYDTRYRVALADRDPAATLRAFERRFPAAGWETRTRDRASPGASRFVMRMGEFLTLVGLAALVIAGIGVGNGVSSYLDQRRQSIAMLKVLGATSSLVTRIYLLQILAVSVVGIAMGLVIGWLAVPLIGHLAGAVLPVAPGWAVQPLPLALAAAYGLLIALAFCAPALVAAGRVPAATLLRGVTGAGRAIPRRAAGWMALAGAAIVALALWTSERPGFAAGFLGAAAGTLLLLTGIGWAIRALAARLPRPRQPLVRLALGGLHRPGARTVALVVALGLGLTLFVLLATIRTSLDGNIRRTIPDRAPALFALDVPPEQEALFRATIRHAAPDATIATVPLMRGTITGYGRTRVADLKTIPEAAWALRGERGLTFAAALPPGSALTAGRWWNAAEGRRPLVSVDERLAKALDLHIGDPLTISVLGLERTARIASFRRIAWDTLGFNFVLVFSPGALADVPHNLAATIDMPRARVPAVTAALLPRFPSTSVIEVGGVLAQVQTVVRQMATAIAAAAGVAVLAGIAVLVGAIAAARASRTYDATILKVLGATRGQVLAVQAAEYAMLAAIMSLVALALGTAGGWYVVTRLFDFAWLPDWPTVAATLAIGAGATVAIGLAGSLPVLRARPAAALRAL
ncbi:FtsX-like permease family protein [Sphingomonas sp. S-NIH.Pt15_0812]|uniref:ABC transporter permease n=1 Tax=Sphingomonas sp. S-NIH.Pt15_0812 TaxID=1920129 RepID=UPI000F7F1DB4|nr:FtsX-like permease family protein [Sphingomonas sp. S-NIH.Pt15_0812]RSU49596.1 ABC transporter permease [Sphingomonas sp. S-NIH.Pt15_0812]